MVNAMVLAKVMNVAEVIDVAIVMDVANEMDMVCEGGGGSVVAKVIDVDYRRLMWLK